MSTLEEIRKLVRSDSRNSTQIGAAIGWHPVSVRKFRSGALGASPKTLSRMAALYGAEIGLVKKKNRKK